VTYDDVNFINRGWINRNRILLNDMEHYITLQLNKASQNKLINEIQIVSDLKNRGKIFKTISHCYSKAPFYKTVIGLIENIIFNQEEDLTVFLESSLKKIAEFLDIVTIFVKSSTLEKDQSLRGENKILEIANCLKTDVYINPIGGIKLYDRTIFKRAGIDLYFIETQAPSYRQFGGPFIPNLSIIDVIMFNSKDTVKEFIDNYRLI